MTDYYPLIARAIAKIGKDSRATRTLVYERARSVCIAELKKRNPPASEAEIERERIALEAAIRRIEDERDAMGTVLAVKGVVGFVVCFAAVFAIEAMLF